MATRPSHSISADLEEPRRGDVLRLRRAESWHAYRLMREGTVKPNAIVANFHRSLAAGADGDGAWPPRLPSYFHGRTMAAARNPGQRHGEAWPSQSGLTTPRHAIAAANSPGKRPFPNAG